MNTHKTLVAFEYWKHSKYVHYSFVIFTLFLVVVILLVTVFEYVTIHKSIHDVIQLKIIILPMFIA